MFPRIDQRVSQPREVNLKKKRPTFNSIVILCWWSGARHTEGEMDGIHAVALEGHRLAWKTGVLIDRYNMGCVHPRENTDKVQGLHRGRD